jgi:hypothetical protein
LSIDAARECAGVVRGLPTERAEQHSAALRTLSVVLHDDWPTEERREVYGEDAAKEG